MKETVARLQALCPYVEPFAGGRTWGVNYRAVRVLAESITYNRLASDRGSAWVCALVARPVCYTGTTDEWDCIMAWHDALLRLQAMIHGMDMAARFADQPF